MELESIRENNGKKAEIYFIPDYVARFDRKTFPTDGYYVLAFTPKASKGKWSKDFRRKADAETHATQFVSN